MLQPLPSSLLPEGLDGSHCPPQLLSVTPDRCGFHREGPNIAGSIPGSGAAWGRVWSCPKTDHGAGELPKCTFPSLPHPSRGGGPQVATLRVSGHTVVEGCKSLGSHMPPRADSQLTSTCFP